MGFEKGLPKSRPHTGRHSRPGPGARFCGFQSGWLWSNGRSPRSRSSGTRLRVLARQDTLEGSEKRAALKIATLTRLKGIGANDATLLTHEIFYRGFRNRRELANWAGITLTPWASGDMQRDLGMGRDGAA